MDASKKYNDFEFPPGEELMQICKVMGVGDPEGAPPRKEGSGPYKRLILKNATLIDGTGNPPHGPHDIVIEGDKIKEIRHRFLAIPPAPGEYEIDCTGKYILPGFVDSHVHIGNPSQGFMGAQTPAEYIYKLWLGHGITTVRECGSLMGLDWTMEESRKSAANEITAPRIEPYAVLYYPWTITYVTDAESTRKWIDYVAKKGIKGIKLFGHYPEVVKTVYEEAKARGLRTSCHHSVNTAGEVNALQSCQMGLTSMEHFLGLPEALSENGAVENFPLDYDFDKEQLRVVQDAHMWRAVTPGSPKWKSTIETMVEKDFTIVPTFVPWEPARDIARFANAEWHAEYTWPALWEYFKPNPICHWSYYWDWTTSCELEMRYAFQIWM